MELKNVEQYEDDGESGIFRFTNASDEDFVTLWNNKEYVYPANSTVIMYIENESPERVQSIRKKFAYRLAEKQYLDSKGFKDIKNGIKSKNGERIVVPSGYDEKVLQPWIDECLKPLPLAKAVIKRLPEQEPAQGGSKAFSGTTENPYPAVDLNVEFADETAKVLRGK